VFDFRVGGRDVAEGMFHGGPVSRFEATHTDIIEHVRIVNTYDMWLDGVHMSTSVTSFEFEPIDEGTRSKHVEHGIFFDRSGPTGRTARRAPGACSRRWATILRDAPPQPQQRSACEKVEVSHPVGRARRVWANERTK
jgi:uncharacterized protein YndB with AHSA1/START domain